MYVFRLQDQNIGNLTNNKGWFSSGSYKSNEIAAISDPDGGRGSDPTSIPTPFARIDLVRTAIKFVNNKGIDQNSNFHKILSDALDIGELFFNYNKYGNDVSLLEWDKQVQVEKLLNSNSKSHQNFGKTLEMYIQQDEDGFNFKYMDKIYILKFNNIPVGGTSPVSLFFSTPNDLSYLNITFPKGNNAFMGNYPLFERDDEFIKFLFSLQFSVSKFSKYFPDFDEYLTKTKQKIQQTNPKLFNEINNFSANYYSANYETITNGVFILNTIPLKQHSDTIIPASDYAIVSEKFKGAKEPLVLKRGHSGITENGRPMTYYNGPYNQQIEVPYEETAPLDERYLPGLTGIKHPYLTVGDFLEPYIIRTVFPIDKNRFYYGNFGGADKSYLLPIKNTFFDFFDKEYLLGKTNDGRKNFEIESRAGDGAKVTLRLPIKAGYIELERIYKSATRDYEQPNPNLDKNEGVIRELRFDIGIFPFFKFDPNTANPEYRIALIDGEISAHKIGDEFSLNYFYLNEKGITEVPINHSRQRIKKQEGIVGCKHYSLNHNFDLLSVSLSGTNIRGILIPNFKIKPGGNDEYQFAIDLGTTYTHIEYSKNGGAPKPFDITKDEIQLVKLHDPSFERLQSVFPEAAEIFDHNFIPEIIEDGHEYFLPFRTSILEINNLQDGDACISMVERNIPFIYEKKPKKDYYNVYTGLKWGLDERTSSRTENFISNIMLIIRNKVLVNNGNLKNTKIVWFFPASMMEGRRHRLESKWNKLFRKYFTDNPVKLPKAISESIAPFYYYYKTEGVISHGKPVVSIDIGGETTDIVIVENNEPILISSFRFAADVIFGDGYLTNTVNNDFIKIYGKRVVETLERNKLISLKEAYLDILKKNNSNDIIAYFFSLEKNKELKDKNIEIKFNEWLADEQDLKIVFVIFYMSLIYHIAKIIKAKNLQLPRYLTFSGTGSKILNILSPRENTLEELSCLIFEKVCNKKFDNEGLTIIRDKVTPKQVTCKGGFLAESQEEIDFSKLKTILIGTEDDKIADSTFTYAIANQDETVKSVEREVNNFLSAAFKLIENKEFNFEKFMLNPSKINKYKEILTKDIYSFIKEGLISKQQEIENETQEVEETLFFYALKGSLNKLVSQTINE